MLKNFDQIKNKYDFIEYSSENHRKLINLAVNKKSQDEYIFDELLD